MALIPSALVKDGNVVGSILPDISSAIGYKETIGSTCVNPDGYTTGKFFVGATDGLFYRATSDIDTGDTITVGTNCEQTDVATVLALLNDDVTSINSDLTELNCGRGYVEVTGDGVKTTAQLLNDLYAQVDKSKLTTTSALQYRGQTIQVCPMMTYNDTAIVFSSILNITSAPRLVADRYELTSASSVYFRADFNPTLNVVNYSSQVVATGTVIRIVY